MVKSFLSIVKKKKKTTTAIGDVTAEDESPEKELI